MQRILLRVLLLAAAELAAMYATSPPGWNDVKATSLRSEVVTVADRCAMDADAVRPRQADLPALARPRTEAAMLAEAVGLDRPLRVCPGSPALARQPTSSASSRGS